MPEKHKTGDRSGEDATVEDFKDRVAVITGGGSGIGEGLGVVLSRLGAHVVLADVAPERVDQAAKRLRDATGGKVLGVVADVASPRSVEDLADAAYAAFGTVNLLFNNAGVTSVGTTWETPLADWRRILDVNLMGCVHGVRSFVPRMLAGGQPGHIVNTSSMAGVLPVPLKAPYSASKHAIIGLSQALAAELRAIDADIGVSVCCPGAVATTMTGDTLRFYEDKDITEADRALLVALRDRCAAGMSPEQAGEVVVEAIRRGRFWVWPNGQDYTPMVAQAHAAMLAEAVGR
jgi:NAD(P)-dependent dehydrogenase (short-subunit alcohol dehydrogenase family)